jgi:hypothetical protein
MSANTAPIFTLTPKIQYASADGDGGTAGPIKTANTNMDGTGTVNTVWTAGANGSYVRKIFARAAGACTQSVLRVFINNGSTSATIANNIFYTELTLPTTVASAISALQPAEIPLEFAIPATYKILVTIGTTVSAGWFVGVIGGDY